jgi:hypothetical protein
MSVKCQKIFEWIEEWADPDLAADWDRIGLLVGSPSDEVQKVLVTLDVTGDVIRENLKLTALRRMQKNSQPFITKVLRTPIWLMIESKASTRDKLLAVFYKSSSSSLILCFSSGISLWTIPHTISRSIPKYS